MINHAPASRKTSYLWEHSMKTVMGLVGTFAAILMGTLFLASKHGRNDIGAKLLEFFFVKHPVVTIVLSVGGAVLFNITTWKKNSRKHHVVRIEFDEAARMFTFGMISIYSDIPVFKKIAASEIEVIPATENIFLVGTSEYKSIRAKNGTEIGRLDWNSPIWEEHFGLYEEALEYIEARIKATP